MKPQSKIIDLHPRKIIDYGCVKCQRHHEKGKDPLYEEHLGFQSKQGIRTWTDPFTYEVKPQ